MSKIQWEYDLVERPFCDQLKTMGWSWIEGDVDVPELTERESFREVLLAVLFINGIPIVVAEFKSPGIENPRGRGRATLNTHQLRCWAMGQKEGRFLALKRCFWG